MSKSWFTLLLLFVLTGCSTLRTHKSDSVVVVNEEEDAFYIPRSIEAVSIEILCQQYTLILSLI